MKPTLKENMTHSLITIKESALVSEAQRLMLSEWIRHLLVTNVNGDSVVGILSDRDLLRAPSLHTSVGELMSTPVRCYDVNTPLRNVAQAMIDNKMSAFLITDGSSVAGIITSEDLLLLLAKMLKDEPSPKWVLSELMVNPVIQKAVDMTAQAGI